MPAVLLQALALASVGLIAPGSITVVILLLMSDHGWRNGLAFALGYVVMYSLIGIGVLVWGMDLAEGRTGEQSLTTSIVLIGLGAVLLLVTIRNWRNRQQPVVESDQASRFSKVIDGISPPKAFLLAAFVSVVNVKNLTIFLSAVSVLLLSGSALTTKLMMLVPVVLVFCTSVIAPVVIYLAFPTRAGEFLTRIKETIDRNRRPLGLVVTTILSALFLYRGISGLL